MIYLFDVLDGHFQCLTPQTITLCRDDIQTLTCNIGQRLAIQSVEYNSAILYDVRKCRVNNLPYMDSRSCVDPRYTEAENVSQFGVIHCHMSKQIFLISVIHFVFRCTL